MPRLFGLSWLLGALLAASLVTAAPAQSPEALTASRELVATMKLADQFKALMPIIMQNLKPALVQGRPEVERDFDRIVTPILDAMKDRYSELAELLAQVYARHFTAGEIRQIEAFYKQPVGRKMLDLTPQLAQQSMAVGQNWGQQIAQEIQGRITDELRKRGHKI